MRVFLLGVVLLILQHEMSAQASLLKAGPMVGYVDMREALLWVQTTSAAEVQFVYWDSLQPATRYYTDKVTTQKEGAFTAKLVADQDAKKECDRQTHPNGQGLHGFVALALVTHQVKERGAQASDDAQEGQGDEEFRHGVPS